MAIFIFFGGGLLFCLINISRWGESKQKQKQKQKNNKRVCVPNLTTFQIVRSCLAFYKLVCIHACMASFLVGLNERRLKQLQFDFAIRTHIFFHDFLVFLIGQFVIQMVVGWPKGKLKINLKKKRCEISLKLHFWISTICFKNCLYFFSA